MKKCLALALMLSLVCSLFVALPTFAENAPTSEGTLVSDLVWANGTLYGDNVADGGGKYIYTKLNFTKGEKIRVEIPGVWNLWVYPAVDGKTTGEYRGGNGAKKIANGEILDFGDDINGYHITAYIEGGAAATVESEAFKTFDLKFYKISNSEPVITDAYGRVWEKGAFYDTAEPNTSVATTRRYTVIDCKEGQTFKFDLAQGDWRVWVYYADENGSIGGKYFEAKNGTEYTVEAIDGKVPTKLRLTACIEKSITDEDWAKFDLQITVTDPDANPPTADNVAIFSVIGLFAALAVASVVVVRRKDA